MVPRQTPGLAMILRPLALIIMNVEMKFLALRTWCPLSLLLASLLMELLLMHMQLYGMELMIVVSLRHRLIILLLLVKIMPRGLMLAPMVTRLPVIRRWPLLRTGTVYPGPMTPHTHSSLFLP